MTGQFFFALLNPALAAVLAATFLALWLSRPRNTYLLLLAIAFVSSGLAFAINDFLAPFEGPVLRLAVNFFFMLAIALACISAMMRAGARPPIMSFAIIGAATAAVFCWFLFVQPLTVARIYTVNAAYLAMSVVTSIVLVRARPQSLVDWLFVFLTYLLFILAWARPVATLLNLLDANVDGPIQQSDYWATVQALTPLLAVTIALTFLAGLGLQLFKELRGEADRDYLTGLLNRRGFEKGVLAALQTNGPGTWPPAIMLADIDNFKQVNDTYGHAVGDKVIIAVAAVLAKHGDAELAGRTGGEEFALFYGQSGRTSLVRLAETIRAELARIVIEDLPALHPITVSIGIHSRHQTETLSEMMARADDALYRAKMAGKDRAVIDPLSFQSIEKQPVAKF